MVCRGGHTECAQDKSFCRHSPVNNQGCTHRLQDWYPVAIDASPTHCCLVQAIAVEDVVWIRVFIVLYRKHMSWMRRGGLPPTWDRDKASRGLLLARSYLGLQFAQLALLGVEHNWIVLHKFIHPHGPLFVSPYACLHPLWVLTNSRAGKRTHTVCSEILSGFVTRSMHFFPDGFSFSTSTQATDSQFSSISLQFDHLIMSDGSTVQLMLALSSY